MATLEQFAETLQGFSMEYITELFYDSLKRPKEWKDRFKQADQEKAQLIIEQQQEIGKVRREAMERLAQALYEKDKLISKKDQVISKMKTDIEKLQKQASPPQAYGMPQEDKVVIALKRSQNEVRMLKDDIKELEHMIASLENGEKL